MEVNGWKLRSIGDFLTESRIPGRAGDEARKLTVRLYGKGVIAKRETWGSAATKYYRRRSGQFIYSKLDALNGAFGIVPESLDGFESTLDLPAFDFRGEVDPDWLLQSVSRPAFYGRFKFSAIGSRKANRVPVDEFLASKLLAPPVTEQRAIAQAIRTGIDALQAAQNSITLLERAKRDAMRRLLTLGMKGDAAELTPLKENWVLGRIAEGVEAIPKDWRLVQLTKYAKLESGHTPSRNHPEYWEGDIPWVSLADTDRFDAPRLLDTTETIGDLGLKHSSARLLPEGTVVFSRTATVGKAAILGRPMATSQDFADWVCGSKVSPRYLLQVFRHMSREWKRLQAGSTHQTIYMPTFKKLQILLPPFDEQEAIADVGEAFDQRIAAERTALDDLRASKDALAQELLSGRVRLPGATIRRLASTDHAEAS
ncbi:restriction endonuclease subunit S [Oceanicaulis sp.]|uniref:restriction endonuclease subunit S n=1 Tax=Oceanicaulis sp. TaxID=1924941 RepID=UPI003BAD8BE5